MTKTKQMINQDKELKGIKLSDLWYAGHPTDPYLRGLQDRWKARRRAQHIAKDGSTTLCNKPLHRKVEEGVVGDSQFDYQISSDHPKLCKVCCDLYISNQNKWIIRKPFNGDDSH